MKKQTVLAGAAVAVVGIAALMLLQPKNKVPAVDNTAPVSATALASENAVSENSNFKKYWAENEDIKTSAAADIIAAREGAKVLGGEKYLNDIFQVYEDETGKFIISYTTKVYLDSDGELPINCYDTLRREETGEKLYVFQNSAAVENTLNALKVFDGNDKGNKLTFAERTEIGHYFGDATTVPKQGIGLRINGIPAKIDGDSIRTREGCVPLDEVCAVAAQYGFIKDYKITQHECTFTVLAAGGEIKMEYQFDSGVNSYKILRAIANGKEVVCDQVITNSEGRPGQAYVPLQHLGDAFGWDFDLYCDTECLNLVTDTKDIPSDADIVLAESATSKTPTVVAPENNENQDELPTGEGFTYETIKSGPNKGQRIEYPTREVMDKWTDEDRNAFCAKIDPEGYRRAAMTWEELVKEDSNYDELPPEEKLLIDDVIATYNS